jgi:serine/threonine protein phosphatase PrpC
MPDVPNIVAHGGTHVGRRRARNEDAFFVGKLQRTVFAQDTSLTDRQAAWMTGASEGWLLMVADGMGGQGSGDLASRAAVVAVLDYLCNVMPWVVGNAVEPAAFGLGVREHLARAVSIGEWTVRQEATGPDASEHMGTTLTLAYILWPHLYVAHVGDSRCYLLRGGHLKRLTTDHTVAERLAGEGVSDIDSSSPWHHMLWNALGADEAQAQPEISHIELDEQDQVLLCSDGLTRHVDDRLLRECLVAGMPVDESADRLIGAANEAGGSDNITVIVARFQSATEAARPLPATHRAA